MNYSVNSFKVCIYKVNPDSWIIRALENNGYNLDNCLELDYLAGFMAIEVYKDDFDWICELLDDFDWVCELLDYTENPDNTREQLLEFYNYARTEYKDLEGYPEYI